MARHTFAAKEGPVKQAVDSDNPAQPVIAIGSQGAFLRSGNGGSDSIRVRNTPAQAEVDFTALLSAVGEVGEFDRHSVRVEAKLPGSNRARHSETAKVETSIPGIRKHLATFVDPSRQPLFK